MNSLKPSNSNEQPSSLMNNMQFLGNGFRVGGDNESIDKLHLYKDTVGGSTNYSFNSSVGPYMRNMQRRSEHSQKYF